MVFHAGDWVEAPLLDELERRSRRLVGVFGNNDPPELRERLPLVARVELEGLRIAVIHETGPSRGREQRADEQFPATDLLVFGHSHIPWDSRTPQGMRLLNPGSPTDRRRQPECTWMTATASDGAITEVELVGLSPA